MDERQRRTYEPLSACGQIGGPCESGALRSSYQTCSSHGVDARFWIVVLILLVCWTKGTDAIRCSCDHCGKKIRCSYPSSSSCFVEVRRVADRSGEFWPSRRGCATADRVPELCASVPASGGDVSYSTHDGSVVFCCRSESYCSDAIIATLAALKGNLSSLPTNSALAVVRELEETALKADSSSSSGNSRSSAGVSAGHLGLVAALNTLCTIVVLGTGVMFFCVCWRRRLQRRRAKLHHNRHNHNNNNSTSHHSAATTSTTSNGRAAASPASSHSSRVLSSGEIRIASLSSSAQSHQSRLPHSCGAAMAATSPFHQVVNGDGMVVSPSCSLARCAAAADDGHRCSAGSPSAHSVSTVASTSRHSPPTMTSGDHLLGANGIVAAAAMPPAPALCAGHAVPSPMTTTSSMTMTAGAPSSSPLSGGEYKAAGGGVRAALHRDFPPAYDDIDRPAAGARNSIRVDLPPQYSACCEAPHHLHHQYHHHHQQQQQQQQQQRRHPQRQPNPAAAAAAQRQQQWDTWDGEGIMSAASSAVLAAALHTHHDVPPNRHVTDTPDCGTPLPWDCPGAALHPAAAAVAAPSAGSRAAAVARVMHVAPPPNRTISDKV